MYRKKSYVIIPKTIRTNKETEQNCDVSRSNCVFCFNYSLMFFFKFSTTIHNKTLCNNNDK